jgi:hypothetical protein
MEPLGNVLTGRLAGKSRPTQSWSTAVRFLVASLVVVLSGTTVVLARNLGPNQTTDVNSTLGAATVTMCSDEPVLTLIPTISGEVERISEISVDNIPIGCAGKNLVVEFQTEEGVVLDRIVWSLSLMNLADTSISARADGTRISTANTSSSNVSVNYPAIEVGSSGLDSSALSSTSISSFTIEATVSAVSE